jgi:hypothetical protein
MEKKYQRYIDPRGFQVDYPDTWEGREAEGIVFLYAPVNEKANFKPNLNISITPLNEDIRNMDDYTQLTFLQLEAVSKEPIISFFEEIAFVGTKGQLLVYDLPFNNKNNRILQCWTVNKDYIITATYTDILQDFKNFLEDAKEIIDSIKSL